MKRGTVELPQLRPEIIIRPLGEYGQYVVKLSRSGEYFHLGEEEHFLLTHLDGELDADEVCVAFEERFGQPLSAEELDEFIEVARAQALLEPTMNDTGGDEESPAQTRASPSPPGSLDSPSSRPKQSILYWRRAVFDPDRLLTWLEPKIRFFWSRAFVVVSAAAIVSASMVLWTAGPELLESAAAAMRWETLVLAWLVTFAIGTLHEFAHGLTCKHHGGEVREIGFLLMYFMPCFYCNVSDAWLFREKSKRLWVTLAGGYFELFLWALAVFIWRLTVPASHVHYLAFVVLSVSGVGSLFNFNPLLKLDGYYLLSDWLDIPNLKQRANDYFQAQVRRLFWGAPRPEPEPRRRTLLVYGLLSWGYSVAFLALVLFAMMRFLGTTWGLAGLGAVTLLAVAGGRHLFRGFFGGEVRTMMSSRIKRTAVWIAALGGVVALGFLEIEDWEGGPCLLRPAMRAEVEAPVTGFVEAVNAGEGTRVSTGQCLVRLRVPELESRIARKEAEVTESRARLRLLEIAARPEEIVEQRRRIERAERWRDLAEEHLREAREALSEDLARLDSAIEQCGAEVEAAHSAHQRAEGLLAEGVLSREQSQEAVRALRVARARCEQAHAERRAREAVGAGAAEAELARRENELAEARAALALLELPTRPEEIEAERARLSRLDEELRYLESLREKSTVTSPIPGVITTPRLEEKVGHHVREGDLLCVVEEPAALEVEIALPEDSAERVLAGQAVSFKVRGFPYHKFRSRVERVAPVAREQSTASGQPAAAGVPSTVTVCCPLEIDQRELRLGMTGYARIGTGRRPIGTIAADRILRFVRTEFWW